MKPSEQSKESLTYKAAGVDIAAGEELVARIKAKVQSTFGPQVLTQLGGFGGLFALDVKAYKEPVLVSSTDGVGTKLKIAFALGRHNTVGIDLVAMGVNDILVSGARPLFFLDYFATGKLEVGVAETVIGGVVEGCKQAGCALLGGETAEMPDFYPPGEYDLAGFAVGVVEREKIIDGKKVKPGDVIIGMASSGLHSNGYSLARKVLLGEKEEAEGRKQKAESKKTSKMVSLPPAYRLLHTAFPELGRTLGEELLVPTRIYVKSVLALLEEYEIKALAHITGGGMVGNLPRVLPENCCAQIERKKIKPPPIFELIRHKGKIDPEEMLRVFNMGVGMILIVSASQGEAVVKRAEELGEQARIIGEIVEGEKGVVFQD